MSDNTGKFIELTMQLGDIRFSSRMSLLQWQKHKRPQAALEKILKDLCRQMEEAVAENIPPPIAEPEPPLTHNRRITL